MTANAQTWRAHTDGEIRHVWPENDTFEHSLEDEDFCVCSPRHEEVHFGVIIIHNAFDDREELK